MVENNGYLKTAAQAAVLLWKGNHGTECRQSQRNGGVYPAELQ